MGDFDCCGPGGSCRKPVQDLPPLEPHESQFIPEPGSITLHLCQACGSKIGQTFHGGMVDLATMSRNPQSITFSALDLFKNQLEQLTQESVRVSGPAAGNELAFIISQSKLEQLLERPLA